MLWGRVVPDPARISLRARRGSDEQILGLIRKFYPGSWLPSGIAQIESTARPYFSIVSAKDGRLDYIETMTQWGHRARAVRMAKVVAALSVAAHMLVDRDVWYRLQSMRQSCNQECFRRELMHHQRILLEKRPTAA